MGTDLSLGIFVDDATFVPTTEQLVGIAAILEEFGVIDHAERESLEQRITTTYHGEDGPLVMLNGESMLGFYQYEKISPEALPYFYDNYMGGGDIRHWIIIYNEPRFMQYKKTRLVIAELRDPAAHQLGETEALDDILHFNPFFVSLRSRLEELLGVPVLIEVFMR
ncbi:MAG TPA: hypothetical protein VKM55_23485 [Candidatus Lokiarchaeia archaeon]|nr:hypothetical protein [Candidatus Lokiarchaeia archaeon]